MLAKKNYQGLQVLTRFEIFWRFDPTLCEAHALVTAFSNGAIVVSWLRNVETVSVSYVGFEQSCVPDNRRMVPELLILVKAGMKIDGWNDFLECCRNNITGIQTGGIYLAITDCHFEGHRCCNALCGLYAAFVGHRFVHIWHWIYPVAQRRKGWGAPTNIVCLESKIKPIFHFSQVMKQLVSTTSTLLSCLRYQTLKMANDGQRNFQLPGR